MNPIERNANLIILMTAESEAEELTYDQVRQQGKLNEKDFDRAIEYLLRFKLINPAIGIVQLTMDGEMKYHQLKNERGTREKSIETAKEQSVANNPTKVWVVHGRNLKARDAMFEFLSAVGLQPLEWSQAKRATGKPNASIPEILDIAFSTAGAVVVLFTPDDIAYLRDEFRGQRERDYEINPTPQARPNVLFEAGIAMGRNPSRTVLVELGDLRPFTDISGLHLVRINDSSVARQDLADSLINAKCPVDLSGRRWHTAGKFDAALEGL